MCLQLENCCCCINVQSGAKYIGITGVLVSVFFFLLNGILLSETPVELSPEIIVGIIVFGDWESLPTVSCSWVSITSKS